MTGRRGFLKTVGSAAGAAVLGDLAAARRAFATEVHRIPPLAPPESSVAGRQSPIADEYFLSPDVVYLNHASIGTIPRAVHAARNAYLELCETNPWLYMWGGAWEEPREEVRHKTADLLRCRPGEVAFTHNTTEGFNTIAQGLPLGPGDEVLFSSMNHPGASVCWHHHAAARGFTVTRFAFPIADVPTITADEVLDAYDRHITARTRVLVFPHVDNMVGLRYPVRALARLAHDRGVEWVAVDGAQSLGMLPVRLDELGVDFYAGSPHKWLQAPKGLGVLYVREDVRDAVRPMWVTWGQERWAGTARVFEDYGTRNLPEVLTLGDALDFQARLGETAKMDRYRALWERARAVVADEPGLAWRSPTTWERAAPLFAVETRGADSREVFADLNQRFGMVYRAFHDAALNTARLSPNTITTDDELERTLRAMARHAR